MGVETGKTFHPLAVWRKALALWIRYLVPLVALASLSVLLARMVHLSKPLWSVTPPTFLNVAFSAFFVLEVICALIAHAFISLLVMNHIRGYAAGRMRFPEVFEAAKRSLHPYVRTLFALIFFLYMALTLGAVVYGVGVDAFRSPSGDQGIKTAILIGTSTFFVVVVLALLWYGFYFSLAPLVAAYEHKGPLTSIRESRRRVRGNALRYLVSAALFFVPYVGLNLSLYKVKASPFILNLIDPTMVAVFGPLGLALWYLSYEALSAGKKI